MGDVVALSGAVRRLASEIGKIASDLRLLQRTAGRNRRDQPASRPAGFVDHAGEGEPLGAGNGQSGLLSGPWLRCHDCRRRRSRPARAERHDAGHRVERAARVSILDARLDVSARPDDRGLEADAARCRELLDRSTAMATALSPYLGYAKTAELAKDVSSHRPSDPRAGARTAPARDASSTASCRSRR